ncbi:MAG: hypothetical protein ACK48Q_09830 [Burkholderiales bacterium]
MLNTLSPKVFGLKYVMHMAIFALASLIVGCGGGSGSSSSTDASNTSSGSSSTALPAQLQPGAFVASLFDKDWVGMLLPIKTGTSTTYQFFGLHYNGSDPDIYSASSDVVSATTALPLVYMYPNISAAVRTGSGTLSHLGNNVVLTSLAFPSAGLELAKSINVAASPPNNYKYNTPANLSTVQGNWTGRLGYSLGFSENFSMSISSAGAISTAMSFQQDCVLSNAKLAPNFDGTNLFSLSLSIPTSTQCSLKSQTLNGAAFVTASPSAGKTQRLYLVGVTTDGRGISFKADR